jgi:tryptophan halogenase
VKKIRSIAIVGGGSSGWMSACYLSRILNDVRITLIESKTTPRIGVGEATVSALTRFMNRLGFTTLPSWLPECDGTIKTGILFEDWYEQGDKYWHPFDSLDYLDDTHHAGHYWLHARRAASDDAFSTRDSFYKSFYSTTILNADQHCAPINNSYAYHLNADLFGDLLQRASRNVEHILDNVVDIKLDESGSIEHLVTAEHGIVQADLYVDCTGFRRYLIRHVDPRQPFESYAQSLFCDRAIVLRFPYESDRLEQEMHPYVKASTRSAGWMWTIPLYSRISSGYVYSSNFQSEEAADRELRAYWGEERMQQAIPLTVKFESGKLENVWVKNCVAIGLAGSFIEPLESTGLAITQLGLEILASVLDARYYNDFTVRRYNMHIQKLCDDIMHFIVSHYCFTNRQDTPFWRAVKHETKIPEELAERLDVFRRLLPTEGTKGIAEVWFFRDVSWFSVLLGMNFPFEIPNLSSVLVQKGMDLLARKREEVQKLSAKVPGHVEFLKNNVYAHRRWYVGQAV